MARRPAGWRAGRSYRSRATVFRPPAGRPGTAAADPPAGCDHQSHPIHPGARLRDPSHYPGERPADRERSCAEPDSPARIECEREGHDPLS